MSRNCQWFLCKKVFLTLKCHHLSHRRGWAGNSPLSGVWEHQNGFPSVAILHPGPVARGWVGGGSVSLVRAHGGSFSRAVAVAVCACCTWSFPSGTSGCPGCCGCASLFWVEKHAFPGGHFRHSPGKLLYRIVIPPPRKIACLDWYLLRLTEDLWAALGCWVACFAFRPAAWERPGRFHARLLEMFWAGRTAIIENPLICPVASYLFFHLYLELTAIMTILCLVCYW